MAWNILDADGHDSKVVHINFKAIAVLLVLAAAVCGGVHFWHTQQVARHTPLVLEEAKKRQRAEEYASALAYYETYLGYRPNDADAIADHALLKAKLATNKHSGADAFYSLRRALNVLPGRSDLTREFVRLGVLLNRVRECETELKQLLSESPDDPEVLLIGARAAVRLRQFDKARPLYERVLDTPAADKFVYVELIRLLSGELKDQAGADEMMVRMLERYADSAEVHAAAAVYYFQHGKLDLADTELALAMSDQTSTSHSLVRLQGQIARARRRPLELESSLNKLVELSASDHRAELELAELEISLGRRLAAIQRLKRLGHSPDVTIEHLWHAILMLDSIGAGNDVVELRDKLNQRDRDGAYADSLTMREKMSREDWKGALEYSRALINRTNVSARFLSMIWQWRADCCEKTDDLEGMLAALRRAVAARGEETAARGRMAQLLFKMGRFAESQTEYATLVQTTPSYAGEFVSLLQQSVQGQMKPSIGREEVENLFRRWRVAMPGKPLPAISQLDFYLRIKDREQAERLIQEGLRQWPKELGFHFARISLHRENGDWPAAFASLDEADAAFGQTASLLTQRIICLEQSAPGDLRQQMEACAESFRHLGRDGQAVVWPVLLRGLQRVKSDPKIIAQLHELYAGNNPTDVKMLMFQVQVAVASSDLEAAQRHLETLRTTAGEQSPAYKVAAVLCDLKSGAQGNEQALNKAQAHLDSLLESPGDFHPLVATLQADLLLIRKRPREALQHLQTAIDAGDQRLSTLKRTLNLMVILGQLDQPLALLKSLQQADAAESSTSIAGREAMVDDLLPKDRSLTSFREVIAMDSEDSWTMALIVYRIDIALERFDEAMKALERAVKLAPRTPIVWANWLTQLERRQPERLDAELSKARDSLSIVEQGRLLPGFLVRQQRPSDARTLLEAARKEAPADPILLTNLINLIRQTSKPQAAYDRLDQLLKEMLADERDEMRFCRKIARRELALLWSASKDYRVYLQAVRLAENAVQEPDRTDVDLMLLAEIYSKHLGYWRPALDAYRNLETVSPPQKQVAVVSSQARIHERRRRWEEERAALETCRKLQPDDSSILLRLLLNAVRRKDAPAAEALHQEIHAGTEDPKVLLHADVLSATFSNDHQPIVARIQQAYRDGQANRDTVQEWLNTLRAFGAMQAICKEELDVERVDTVSRYIHALAQNQNVTEAVAQLSELWKSGRHDVAMSIAASLSSSPHLKPADLDSLRNSTVKMAAAEDAPLRVLTAAATLEDFAGNYPAAIELYRRIVAKAPDNVIALNNLAFLEAVSESSPPAQQLMAIEHALTSVGPVDQLIDTKGMLLLRQGNAEEAAKCFEEAWNQRGEAIYLLHFAWACSELGKSAEAQEHFRVADAADPLAKLHPLERPLDAAWRTKAGVTGAAEQSAKLSP